MRQIVPLQGTGRRINQGLVVQAIIIILISQSMENFFFKTLLIYSRSCTQSMSFFSSFIGQYQVEELISNNQLNIASEEKVFLAVLNWVKHCVGDRVQYIAKVRALDHCMFRWHFFRLTRK